MELRQVQYFVVVAAQRSFSKAAVAVGVAQPALSQQMRRLEDELGVLLLDRSTRPLKVTEAGLAFLARAERILAEANLAKDEMRDFAGVGRGRLVVGALPGLAALWLPELLGRFHVAHPGVELIVREANTEELARVLGLGQLDLALVHAVPGLYTGNPAHRGIVMERLFEEELVVVVAPGHPLAGARSVRLGALRDEPFVLRSRGSGLAHTITTATAAEGFTPVIAAECGSPTTLRALVAAGLGVSIMPRLSAEAPGPEIAVLGLRPSLPSHVAAVAWRSDARPSAAVEALVALIRERVATLPAGPVSRGRTPHA